MQPYLGYGVILTICAILTLGTFGRINRRYYPLILYGMSAGMVLLTTLAGPYLVGSDIHLEYYYALLRNGGNVWTPMVGIPQGTSVLSYLTSNIWAYKLIYPLVFALTPTLLYFMFRKWFTDDQSFLASFLFIAFPPFFMEIPTIPRQMIAEVFLILTLFTTVKSSMSMKLRIPLLLGLGALVPLVHYALGFITLIVFSLGLLLNFLLKQNFGKSILVVLAAVLLVTIFYFPKVEDGAVIKKIGGLYNGFVPACMQVNVPPLITPRPPPELISPAPKEPTGDTRRPFLRGYTTLIRIGLGADFLEVSWWGKAFRILQWTIVFLLLVGLWKLRKNRNYWIFAGGAFLISALGLVPGWASIMNITRFAHLSLIVLAPAFTVALRPKYLLVILVPYFLFTSGFVFEASKQPNVETPEVPYSVGLSDYRIDLGASFTEDDVKVRQYILDNNLFPLYSDVAGNNWIGEKVGLRGDINWALPKTGRPLYSDYVYVRSRNYQDGAFTVWWDVGLRRYVDPKDFGIDFDSNIVYQSGDARIIRIGD